MDLIDRIIQIESGGNPYAKASTSSATGLGQFTAGDWIDAVRRHRPDLVTRYSRPELLSMRTDPVLSRELLNDRVNDYTTSLHAHGLDATPGNIYLSHFAGPSGAASILGASDTAPVSSVLSSAAINANPFLRNMTVADLRQWAARKMENAGPSPPMNASPLAQPPQAGTFAAPAMAAIPSSMPPTAPQANDFSGASPLASAALMQALNQQQPQPIAPPQLNFPTPPGLAYARLLSHLMAQNAINGA